MPISSLHDFKNFCERFPQLRTELDASTLLFNGILQKQLYLRNELA